MAGAKDRGKGLGQRAGAKDWGKGLGQRTGLRLVEQSASLRRAALGVVRRGLSGRSKRLALSKYTKTCQLR